MFGFYLDFEVIFDKTGHNKLTDNFQAFGFEGKLRQLLGIPFSQTKQGNKVKDVESNLKKMKSGVPHGSNLGPLMFLVYVNDLPQAVESFSSYGYVDYFKVLMKRSYEATHVFRQREHRSEKNPMSIKTDRSKILCLKGPSS